MNGGYVLVDCKKMNLLAQSSQTVSGLYARMVEAVKTGKPVIACNCEYGVGVSLSPFPVMVLKEAGIYICTASILQVRISSDDSVTIVSLLADTRAASATRSTKK